MQLLLFAPLLPALPPQPLPGHLAALWVSDTNQSHQGHDYLCLQMGGKSL